MGNDSISNKLQELFELYKSGALTKDEFEALKSELIGFFYEQQKEVVEEQTPMQSDTSKTKVIEEEPQELKTVTADDKPNKIEEGNPVEISKPAVESKKKKPMLVYLVVGVLAISGLAIGLYSFLGLGSNQTLESNMDDELSFDYEVYDTSNDRNAPYLNVRSTPHSESAIDFRLNDGDKVAVLESGIGENNMWLKIKVQNNPSIGYVHGRYIRKIGSSDVEAAQSAEIETFLKAFFKEYQNKSTKLSSTIHPEIGFFEIFNIINCFGSKTDSLRFYDIETDLTKLHNRKPNGGPCGGYGGENDGIFYFKISANNLPFYVVDYDESRGGFIKETVKIPSKYLSSSEIFHVFLIGGHNYNGEFYFTRINGKWFWICQDFCGCPI